MFKKIIVLFIITSLLSSSFLFAAPVFSMDKQDGGIMTWIACLLGGVRVGYMVNDKETNIDLLDLIKFIFPPIYLYYSFVGLQNDGFGGCLAGYFGGGYTTAKSLQYYKSRTKEVWSCLVIPYIIMAFEMIGGKKWSEVVKEENLKK